jgi:AraC-like DNA-binding protein
MKAPSGKKQISSRVPYEKKGIETWPSYTKTYASAILLGVPRDGRRQWIEHPFFRDLNVFSCGFYEIAHGLKWSRHGLDEGVLIYCIDGKGIFSARGTEHTVNAGDILYCHPLSRHAYKADEVSPWTIYWMHLCGDQLSFFSDRMGVSREHPVRSVGIHAGLIQQFRDLLHHFEPAADEKSRLLSNAQAKCILATIVSMPELTPHAARHTELVKSLIGIMRERLTTSLTIEELARHAGISPSYLHRIFKQVIGSSPVEYYNRIRIRTACTLLTSTHDPIRSIAERLGFGDPYYFSRLFKQVCGLSPREYRNGTQEPSPLQRSGGTAPTGSENMAKAQDGGRVSPCAKVLGRISVKPKVNS